MILIIATEADPSTFQIAQWIRHFHRDFRIICTSDEVIVKKINNHAISIYNRTRDYELDLSTVKKFLYRQGDLTLHQCTTTEPKALEQLLFGESLVIRDLIYYQLHCIDHIGHPKFADLNKLIILRRAVDFAIDVPAYLVTTEKKELLRFKNEVGNIVSKTMLPAFIYKQAEQNWLSYTDFVTDDDVANLPEQFPPAFFQRCIDKKFDVRVFFLASEFFAMGILSQNNMKTIVDHRNYDRQIPNKKFRIALPDELCAKLRKMVNALGLMTCSIDLAYGKDKVFYFLEINPVGQFGGLSYSCNYRLEKKIAELLTHE